jgi:uncharacterized membrane protein YdjX (TVP38/TMEM64 family)
VRSWRIRWVKRQRSLCGSISTAGSSSNSTAIVNLVPALLGVSLRAYVLATFIGIIPGSFVYASVGAGLGSVFDRNESFSPASALRPEIVVALVGLAVLAVVPVLYRKLKPRPA